MAPARRATRASAGGKVKPAEVVVPTQELTELSDDSETLAGDTDETSQLEDDPIVKTYDVYINHDLSDQLFAFQYPNRAKHQPYSSSGGRRDDAPVEIRMKADAGIVEMDIPLHPQETYNRTAGKKWGKAAGVIQDEGKSESFGLAGGYSISLPIRSRRPATRRSRVERKASAHEGEVTDRDMDTSSPSESSSESESEGPELQKISLAGKMETPDDTSVQYMAGVFRAASSPETNDELHLNPIQSIVQLAPQLYHVDAVDAAKNLARRAANKQGQPHTESAAQAVHMTAKVLSNEVYDMQEVQKWLRAAQEEPWKKTAFYDEETMEAWHRYTKLFLDDDGKSSAELKSSLSDKQWLYTICPKKPADYEDTFADLGPKKQAEKLGEKTAEMAPVAKATTKSPASASKKGKAKEKTGG